MIEVVSGALVFPMFTSHFQCLVPLQDMTFWSFFTVRRRASNATGRLLLVKDTVCYRRLAKSVTKVPAALEGSGWVWIHLDEIFCWMILTSTFLRYIDIIASKCWAWDIYVYICIYIHTIPQPCLEPLLGLRRGLLLSLYSGCTRCGWLNREAQKRVQLEEVACYPLVNLCRIVYSLLQMDLL